MKKTSLLLFLLLLAGFLFANGAGEDASETPAETPENQETVDDASSPGGLISTRKEALDTLASIGMTVFDEEIEAPDFTLSLLDGESRMLSDYRGKVVFLNFWATWCGPCRAEMPSMQGLYADLEDEDFVILAINQLEDPGVVREFLETEGFTFPVLMDENGQVSFQYGVRGIPTTYIIGPDGLVIAGKVGTHIYDGSIYRDLFRQLM
jgi:peroxiredoxin/predicted small secreted protein